MIVHAVTQGSREWLALRSGIPTASEFDRIMTPGMKISKSAEKYMHQLLAERMMGHPCAESVTSWMNRGTILEKEAVEFYEFQRDQPTVPVGFISNDDLTVGASPDRLVGEDGCVEIKVPSEHIHVNYLLASVGASAEYKLQTQGQLWITGRKWVDILSYHPEMPMALFRIERDEKFIESLSAAVTEFSQLLEGMTSKLTESGLIKPKKEAPKKSAKVHSVFGADFDRLDARLI